MDSSARCVTFGKVKFGVLICGELYNRQLASSLALARPDVVVDLAHRSMTRFTRSLDRLAQTAGCPVFHVQHVAKNSNGWKWRAKPGGGVGRSHSVDWASYDESNWNLNWLWADAKIWNE